MFYLLNIDNARYMKKLKNPNGFLNPQLSLSDSTTYNAHIIFIKLKNIKFE